MRTTKNNKNATTTTNGKRGKAVIWVRVSTDKQEIETQREQLTNQALKWKSRTRLIPEVTRC